jgi:hypothetical protein
MECASFFWVGRITITFHRQLETCFNVKYNAEDERGQMGIRGTSVAFEGSIGQRKGTWERTLLTELTKLVSCVPYIPELSRSTKTVHLYLKMLSELTLWSRVEVFFENTYLV